MRACTSRQVGMCGLCGAALKKWVDAQVVMGVPRFDAEMAAEDAEDAEMMSAGAATVMPTVHAPPVVQVQNQDPSFTNTEPISSADPSFVDAAAAEAWGP